MKRTYLLWELLIALSLSAALLMVLFQFLISNSQFEKRIDRAQATVCEQQKLYEKIHSVFFALDHIFYTEVKPKDRSMCLFMRYNAGIDPDPAFSGLNLGRLFIDDESNLRFVQSTLDLKEERSEILLKDVRALEWEFLGHASEKDAETTYIANMWGWLSKWKSSNGAPPPLVRLRLWHGIDKKKQREPNLKIAFILPSQYPISIIKKA